MMAFTDAELERNWVSNGRRPQSTMAQQFQTELGELFNLDGSLGSITDLNSKLDERKQNLGKTNQELADLDARLREMEQRLSRVGYHVKPAQQPSKQDSADDKSKSRPGTARPTHQAPSAGNMPPTPGASENGDGE